MLNTPASTLIGRLLVFSGVYGEWRNVRRYDTPAGPWYSVEGETRLRRWCPLRSDSLGSYWLVEPETVLGGHDETI